MVVRAVCIALMLSAFSPIALSESVETEQDTAPVAGLNEVSWDELVLEQERIMRRYVAASALIGDAQELMAIALDLKSQAIAIREKADALSANSAIDRKAVNSFTKVSKKTNERIRKTLRKNKSLSEDDRIKFTEGLVFYAGAVKKTRGVIKEAEPFAQTIAVKASESVETASEKFRQRRYLEILEVFKENETTRQFATGLTVAKSMPGLLVSHGKTLNSAREYMKVNGIEMPPQATLALGSFSEEELLEKGMFDRVKNRFVRPKTQCPAEPTKYCLWVTVVPSTAKVYLLDVEPSYVTGIALQPRVQRVKTVAEGYETKTTSVDLTKSSQTITIRMAPKT